MGFTDTEKLLSERHGEMNAVHKSGRIPIMYAIKGDHAAIIQASLVEGGALEALDTSGPTPVNRVQHKKGYVKMVKTLSWKGIMVRRQSNIEEAIVVMQAIVLFDLKCTSEVSKRSNDIQMSIQQTRTAFWDFGNFGCDNHNLRCASF